MQTSEWENLEILNKYFKKTISNSFNDFELLNHNITRNEKLELVGDFIYSEDGGSLFEHQRKKREEDIVGTVRIIDSEIKLSSPYFPNSTTVLKGITRVNSTIKFLNEEKSSLEENYSIKSINIELLQQGETYVTIEWVCNMTLNHYQWPNGTTTKGLDNSSVTFNGNAHSLSLNYESESLGGSQKCCHINVQGYNIYFGTHSADDIDKKHNPGFIIYEGSPDENLRIKIRSAISFLIGNKLLYLGCVERNSQMQTLRAEYTTPNLMGGLFREHQQSNPLLLMNRESRAYYADSLIISKMVNRFIEEYDKYDLTHALWLYWHATIAPAHLRGVCFGGMLEFIQKKYIDINSISFKKSLLDKAAWKNISKPLLKIIADVENINEIDKKVLENKIGNLNITPQSILTERFFSSLQLKLGSKEKSAYTRRNDAAHGNKTPNDDYVSLIRESKILHILCNRVMIKILSLSDNYVDFYTIGHPIRDISDNIPD